MRVVAADGLDVAPVEVDELQIGVAETYDVVVAPREDRAFTLMAETIDRSGFARGTLAPRAGMAAEIPALRPRPVLAMKDMAMAHGAMAPEAAPPRSSAAGSMDHGAMDHGAMDHGAMDHGAMDHGGGDQRHDHRLGAGVDMIAETPANRLADPPLGLADAPHRVLTYAMLESRAPNPDARAPGREIELHLTGNMSRYMWSFDGVKFSDADGPIDLAYGERVRLTFVNDTMMSHPIHLHGMFFDVVTQAGPRKPRKHTITVKPGDKFSVDVTADAPGDWAFHCHLLYHMAAGMMRIVRVAGGPDAAHEDHDGRAGHGGGSAAERAAASEPAVSQEGADHRDHMKGVDHGAPERGAGEAAHDHHLGGRH
jgi:CopA family copper-resistance protein